MIFGVRPTQIISPLKELRKKLNGSGWSIHIWINVSFECIVFSYSHDIGFPFSPTHTHTWLECSPMARETWVQSQVESYQRLKKWYLMLPCLTLSIIRYGSMVKWSNPGKGVAPSPTPWCSCYWKESLRVSLNYGRQLYLLIYIVTLHK